MMPQDEENYIQQIFHSLLVKLLPTWADATKFADKSGVNLNTLKMAYYNDGQVGIQAMNQIVKHLLNLSPDKVASIIHEINLLAPIAESQKIWNTVDASEDSKIRIARYAKAISEIDKELKK
jgi:hypothetical protein